MLIRMPQQSQMVLLDEGRAMYLKYAGTLDSACTITITPNSMKRVHIIENATSGSQNIIIKQASSGGGDMVTIARRKSQSCLFRWWQWVRAARRFAHLNSRSNC